MPFSKSTSTSLAVAGSAAHMHTRDYIEIINVVYKDEFDGCCGKDHSSPESGGNEPLLRKTRMLQRTQRGDKRHDHKEPMNRKPPRIYSAKLTYELGVSGRATTNFQKNRTKAQTLLPDIIHTSKIQQGPKPENNSGKHPPSDHGLPDAPTDNFICSCKEGLVYLKKTYQWQNLLGDYRDEILKLRDSLKEKEQTEAKRGRFKRSSTVEQRKTMSELFKEYRSNSYKLLRMRMEERMRHEHRVFEKLSHKMQRVRMNMSDDSPPHYSEKHHQHKEVEEYSSRTPTPPPSSSSEEEEVYQARKAGEKLRYVPVRNVLISTREQQPQQDRTYRTPLMKSSPKLYSKRFAQAKKSCANDDGAVNEQRDAAVGGVLTSSQRLGSSGKLRKPQQIVVRKRVVRCVCRNY